MFVYLLYHSDTDDCYIGQTTDFVKRFLEHNLNGGWKAIMVLETRKYKEVIKRWKENTSDIYSKVLKGLKLSVNYKTKIYLDYDKYENFKHNKHYSLPKNIWDTALKVP